MQKKKKNRAVISQRLAIILSPLPFPHLWLAEILANVLRNTASPSHSIRYLRETKPVILKMDIARSTEMLEKNTILHGVQTWKDIFGRG